MILLSLGIAACTGNDVDPTRSRSMVTAIDIPLEAKGWRIEQITDDDGIAQESPSVEFVDGVIRIRIDSSDTGNSSKVSVWSRLAPTVTAGTKYVMDTEARIVGESVSSGNYLVGFNALSGNPHFSPLASRFRWIWRFLG